jgi:hypothetical protein
MDKPCLYSGIVAITLLYSISLLIYIYIYIYVQGYCFAGVSLNYFKMFYVSLFYNK